MKIQLALVGIAVLAGCASNPSTSSMPSVPASASSGETGAYLASVPASVSARSAMATSPAGSIGGTAATSGSMPARAGMPATMGSGSTTATAGSAPVMVGGAAMFANRDIIDNAVNSNDHKTLVAAVKAAGLVETLKGAGPFTVFAPTDAAFAELPSGTVDSLVKPENKATLTKVLTYHVVPGALDAAALQKQIAGSGGKAMLRTAAGGSLTATASGNAVMITDDKGRMSRVTIADVRQSNGVIHVVDKVLLPN